MEYPTKYLTLIDFFIKKRDETQGGVEGYDSNFSFSEEDLRVINLNRSEVIKMLEILKTEVVWPRDEDGDKHKDTVITDYAIERNKITIIGCTTEKAERFIKKIKHKIKKSVIEVNHHNRTIRYGDKEAIFSKAGRWNAFCFLHRSFPEALTYEDIWFNTFQVTSSGAPMQKMLKKQVQNVIDGIKTKLNKKGFPEDMIASEKNCGYRLTI